MDYIEGAILYMGINIIRSNYYYNIIIIIHISKLNIMHMCIRIYVYTSIYNIIYIINYYKYKL